MNNLSVDNGIKTIRCTECNRELTDPESRRKKIGPKCERKKEAKSIALYMNPGNLSFWDHGRREGDGYK